MTKKNIRYINWESDTVADGNQTWVIPQILANMGSHWPLVKGVNGKVSFKETIRAWGTLMDRGELTLDGTVMTKKGLTNLLNWLNLVPRGEVLGSGARQTAKDWIRYNAGVPLVLSAFKEYRDVGYSAWDWSDSFKEFLVDGDIVAWSNHFGEPVAWSTDELLGFREGSLTVKTGKNQGTVRKPQSTTQVYGVTDPEFKGLPRLMKLNLTQLWCFHPSLVTRFTIGSHMDLDNPQAPLVAGEVLEAPSPRSQASMWDLV